MWVLHLGSFPDLPQQEGAILPNKVLVYDYIKSLKQIIKTTRSSWQSFEFESVLFLLMICKGVQCLVRSQIAGLSGKTILMIWKKIQIISKLFMKGNQIDSDYYRTVRFCLDYYFGITIGLTCIFALIVVVLFKLG